MLARLRIVPYSILRRLPRRTKIFLDHIVARHFLIGMIAIVVNDAGDVLIVKHTYRPSLPWGFPSGWLKRDESPPEAMAREVKEETGFNVNFVKVLATKTGISPLRLDVWLLYAAAGGDFRPSSEVTEYRWIQPDSAPPLLKEQEIFLRENWESLRRAV